ncbi:MAG: PTS sugar transporter subunit IIA [Phycisphaerae bacterium]
MSAEQVAAYLHLDVRDVAKLASRGQIPCRRVKGQFQFRKDQVDHWVESNMHALDAGRLEAIEKGVVAHHGVDHASLEVCPLIPPKGLAVPLRARTREGAIRDLVDLADASGTVYDRDRLIDEVRCREELCSTALVPGAALPHPRRPLPYDVARSFIVVGSAPSGIPYGAEDGSLTRLFFLICCKDDRTHLHVLARLVRMLHAPGDVDALLAAEDGDELREMLARLEEVTVGQS